MANIPYGNVHVASLETDVFTEVVLRTGDTPAITTTPEVAAVTLAQYSVVARDGAGKLILATVTTGVSNAIGITASAVDVATVGGNDLVPLMRSGMFNPDALVWDATYTTDALKRLAFEAKGAQIFLRKPLY